MTGNALQADDAAARRFTQPGHLVEERRVAHQFVGQHHGEGLIADGSGSATNRVAQPVGRVLIGEADPHVASDRFEPLGHCLSAGRPELVEHVVGRFEIGLDGRLVVAGDDHDVIDAGTHGLVDDQLQCGSVDDGQELLRHRFGGRQEPGSHSGRGDDGGSNLHSGDVRSQCGPLALAVDQFDC